MARAKRHYLPGYVWHITHRCHKKDFLLKFGRDRRRWLQWLFEAKKRYGLCILNYIATSNHVHLLVLDDGPRDAIPRSMQLLAGRTGQEYNQRKDRKGAFWEDRYHATAVETDDHLLRCIVYMDLNMVRAAEVGHPREWEESGYQEVQSPRKRYGLIDHGRLMDLLHISSMDMLQRSREEWIEEALKAKAHSRDSRWTESIAVGNGTFLEKVKDQLQIRAKGRKVLEEAGECCLREGQAPYPYNHIFQDENGALSPKNTALWEIYDESSMG